MFTRRHRLSQKDFPDALKQARRRSSVNVSALFPKDGHGYAVVVPKKTVRLSVGRHRLKRRVYAILQDLQLPHSVILFPRASAAALSFSVLHEEIEQLIASGAR